MAGECHGQDIEGSLQWPLAAQEDLARSRTPRALAISTTSLCARKLACTQSKSIKYMLPLNSNPKDARHSRQIASRALCEAREDYDNTRGHRAAALQDRSVQDPCSSGAHIPTPPLTASGSENHVPQLEEQPSLRSVAQQRRRAREREEAWRLGLMNSTSPGSSHTPATGTQSLNQIQRRLSNRHRRQAEQAPYPTPMPSQRHADPTPVNNRMAAQRRRRERERAERLMEPGPTALHTGARRRTRQRLDRDVASEDEYFMAARQLYQEPAARHDLGRMDVECMHCHAYHWMDERLAQSSRTSPRFSTCCDQGQVVLPLLEDPPNYLQNLMTSNTPKANVFRTNLWKYNRALAFTSLGVCEDFGINSGQAAPVFRICGDLHHYSAALTPSAGQTPRYAQVYMFEPRAALDHRMSLNGDLDRTTLDSLQKMLDQSNPFARLYRNAYETMSQTPDIPDVQVRLRLLPGQDRRRYNTPTSDEFAIIMPGNEASYEKGRDIILRLKGQGLQRLDDLHPAYAPLQYPLLFPRGEPGWSESLKLRLKEDHGIESTRRLTQTRYAAFRLQHRPNESTTLLRGGRLLNRYIVDMWASADQNKLRWIQTHQTDIRAEVYSGLEDALYGNDEDGGGADPSDLGRPVVLPSSYIGGPRNMMQRYQDAMAIARHHRKVDFFITMTCNPKWPEIQRELLEGQTEYDRPDLVSRVFSMKLKDMLDDITKHGIFGKAVAHVYTIEFQKRGLPHAHILIFLEQSYKLITTQAIDACIRAYWPDPVSEPLLFETIKSCMVHGPCGALNPSAPCMDNGKCTKGFPKPFCNETSINANGFPDYMRKDDGRQYQVKNYAVDNRWIVAHNPYLSAKYHCHINVECAASLGSIGYVVKYMEKGPDRATLEVMKRTWERFGRDVQVNERDEIQKFIMGRYLAAPEAAWRIFHFPIHKQSPSVETLQVHLPGQHLVAFNPSEVPSVIMQRASEEKTKLTAFFDANKPTSNIHDRACRYTYHEFPEHFVYVSSTHSWKLREGPLSLGRMVFVPPNAGERFYLRTLLTVVKGPTSFKDVRTYQGVVHPTFRDACLARGLLEDDGEWRQCLQEAADMGTGERLRHLYVTIMLFCNPSQPEVLWDEFRDRICDNLSHRLSSRYGVLDPTNNQVYDYGLYLINKLLQNSGRSLEDWPAMPKPICDWSQLHENPLIIAQLNYDQDTELRDWRTRYALLNSEQRLAYTQVVDSIENDAGRIFFLHGSGGTGKTFVYKTICNKVRSEGWIVLCVASSGIAALLLPGGRTSHSTFSIPVGTLSEDSTCNIPKQSPRADLLRRTRAIIWDEAVPQHRYAFEAVDRTCRDIRDNDRPFGGITVVFGGDFQQTLPIVKRGSREDIVSATITQSYLWSSTTVLQLTQNMRLDHDDPSSSLFSQWLIDVGHGRNLSNSNHLALPDDMLSPDSRSLIDFIYPSIDSPTPPSPIYFLARMILAPRNSEVSDVNSIILDRISGEKRTYISADKIIAEDSHIPIGASHPVPVEFLRSVNASGLPPGELSLKLGAPLILLRNLAAQHGLCNGTRMVVKRMMDRVLEVEIIGGEHNGTLAFIPRISLIPSDSTELTFSFSRRQFPVQLAFALTINKSQGQSVRYVGLDLRTPVFAHGQLYVALSRATSGRRIRVLLPEKDNEHSTVNVVYPEALID